jgi:antitoxin component of MazEF toxin-antitoxin module
LGVRIPKHIARAKSLRSGSRIRIEESALGILIKSVPKSRSSVTLNKLLSHVTSANLHSETDWGTPVGNEIW